MKFLVRNCLHRVKQSLIVCLVTLEDYRECPELILLGEVADRRVQYIGFVQVHTTTIVLYNSAKMNAFGEHKKYSQIDMKKIGPWAETWH